MSMYPYAYLAGSLYFLAIWAYIFLKKPHWRKTMVLFGVAFFWIGVLVEYLLWTSDYWHPETITGTIIGPEDFIMSFTHVVIPAVLYKFVFRKGVSDLDIPNKEIIANAVRRVATLFFLAAFSLGILVFVFHTHSAVSTSVPMFLIGLYIASRRNDLFIPMLWSGVLMALIVIFIFLIVNIVFPGLVYAFWDDSLHRYVFFGIPTTDILWYFLLGFFMGGMYEFLTGAKLEDAKR